MNEERAEAFFRDQWAMTLGGRTEVRLTAGRADIVTDTHVYEVKEITAWKGAVGQAIVYSMELQRLPGVALYGAMPPGYQGLGTILDVCCRLGVVVLLNVWTTGTLPDLISSEVIAAVRAGYSAGDLQAEFGLARRAARRMVKRYREPRPRTTQGPGGGEGVAKWKGILAAHPEDVAAWRNGEISQAELFRRIGAPASGSSWSNAREALADERRI